MGAYIDEDSFLAACPKKLRDIQDDIWMVQVSFFWASLLLLLAAVLSTELGVDEFIWTLEGSLRMQCKSH
jgi:hypothetical protein